MLGKTGMSDHPTLVAVSRARKVNAVCGFGVVAPWEINQLDEAALMEFEALYEYEKLKQEEDAGRQKNEAYLSGRRASHPSYRKY